MMKACLMKVNYDRKYTQPSQPPPPPRKGYEPLQTRIHMAREVYNTGKEKKLLKESLEEAAKRKLRQHEQNKVLIQSMTNPERFERQKRKSADSNQTANTSRLSSHMSFQRNDTPMGLSVEHQRESPAMRSRPNTQLQPLPLGGVSSESMAKEVWKIPAAESTSSDKETDLFKSFLLATSKFDSGEKDYPSVLYAPRPLQSHTNKVRHQSVDDRVKGYGAAKNGQSVIKVKSAPSQLRPRQHGKPASLPERIKKAYSGSSAQNNFAAYKSGQTRVPKTATGTTEVPPPRGLRDILSFNENGSERNDLLYNFMTPRNNKRATYHQDTNRHDPDYIKTVSVLDTPRSEVTLPELKPKYDVWNQTDWASLRNFQSPQKAANYRKVHSYQTANTAPNKPIEGDCSLSGETRVRKDSLASFILSRSACSGLEVKISNGDVQSQGPEFLVGEKPDQDSSAEEIGDDNETDSVLYDSEGQKNENVEDSYTEPESDTESESQNAKSIRNSDVDSSLNDETDELRNNVPETKENEAFTDGSDEESFTGEEIAEDFDFKTQEHFANAGPLKSASSSQRTGSPIPEVITANVAKTDVNQLMANTKDVSFLEDDPNVNTLQILMSDRQERERLEVSVKDIEKHYFRDVFYVSDESCDEMEQSNGIGWKKTHHKKSNTSKQFSSVISKKNSNGSFYKSKESTSNHAKKSPCLNKSNTNSRIEQGKEDNASNLKSWKSVIKEVKPVLLTTTKKDHRNRKYHSKSAKLKQEKPNIKVEQRSKSRNHDNQLTLHSIHPKWATEDIETEVTEETPYCIEKEEGKWAKHRRPTIKLRNTKSRICRLHSKSASHLHYTKDEEKVNLKTAVPKHDTATRITGGLINIGLEDSVENDSGDFRELTQQHKQKKPHMLKYSHFHSASYGTGLSMGGMNESGHGGHISSSQRLTFQRHTNPYSASSSPGAEVQGIKQWKKPKPRSKLFEYNSEFGYMSPLRVVQSTEDLSSHLRSKSGNPYVDTHNEIMDKITQSSARGHRRSRPRSVSDKIKSVLGIQSLSVTPREFERNIKTSPDEESLKKLSHAQKMYTRKSHSSVNMMAMIRTRFASRVTLSTDMTGNSYAPVPYSRSRTVVPSELTHSRIVKNAGLLEQERKAKAEAERAMKQKKVFTIIGPYHGLRAALRRRGWVEKFVNAPLPADILTSNHVMLKKKPAKENADDDDDGTADLKVKPWEEDNGYYGMMSHMARNSTPSFLFTVKTVDVDARVIRNGQLVNHFSQAKHITTKVGLCQSLRNVHWFDKTDCATFYPRCYKMDDKEERDTFIDDFHISACIGLIKTFLEKYKHLLDEDVLESNKENLDRSDTKVSKKDFMGKKETSRLDSARKTSARKLSESKKLDSDSSKSSFTVKKSQSKLDLLKQSSTATCVTAKEADQIAEVESKQTTSGEGREATPSVPKEGDVTLSVQQMAPVFPQRLKKGGQVSERALEIAYDQCLVYLRSKSHEDIDIPNNKDALTEGQWDQFLVWYYQFVHDGGDVKGTPNFYAECKVLLTKLAEDNPQFEMEGAKNIWILKPGAKSRGRGITLCDKMGACLQQVEKDSSLIIQKYIEKPLLVHNTKFDIRQWFLVTDWNPLTVWFYKDSYLRFCSQEFTTDDYHVSIHLSNNSVQKHFQNGNRSTQLPDDNMWTSDEFLDYLRTKGKSGLWYDKVLPGMKKSIICALLCSQEHIEYRKNAFELYGADFMLGEELDPWLIEINSSPCMARNTKATLKLVDGLLEDMCKVVLDRRGDKTSETGRFELLYSQKYVNEPPTIDLSLSVTGRKIKKKDKR